MTLKKKNILIAGCGYIGCALVRQLSHCGDFEIWGLRRNIDALPKNIHSVQGDLTINKKPSSWPERIDYIVYCVGAKDHKEESYRDAYLNGLSNLINYLQSAGQHPERIFFTSSTGVYHQSEGVWVDEKSETLPIHYSGQIMLEAEALLRQSPYKSTAIRFGGIYGPDRLRLLDRAKAGIGCHPQPSVYGNRIHREDCAGILKYLLNMSINSQSVKSIYLGVDDDPAPIYDVLQWFSNELGVLLDPNHPPPARGNKRGSNALIKSEGYIFNYPDFRSGYRKHLLK